MTLFSKIIRGEIPSYRIAEDDRFFAFLDIHPLVRGHVLVVPKVEVDKLFDLEESYLSGLLVFARPIARALEQEFPCNRVGLSVVGIEVPHAHLHLIPINSADDLNFTRPKLNLPPREMEEIQKRILSRLK
ncbi:MAG TPA: HIT family protein [Chitinophagaceae bacterium]|nr:HIT family protein [Chitinophagaceae bacterium]